MSKHKEHGQPQLECQIFIASKNIIEVLLLSSSSAPVGSDNSGHGRSKSLKILQIPAAPLLRSVSCRVVLPLMCEMTEGVRRTNVWVKMASVPQIDDF